MLGVLQERKSGEEGPGEGLWHKETFLGTHKLSNRELGKRKVSDIGLSTKDLQARVSGVFRCAGTSIPDRKGRSM